MWDPGFCQPSTCHNRTSSGSHSENGVPRSPMKASQGSYFPTDSASSGVIVTEAQVTTCSPTCSCQEGVPPLKSHLLAHGDMGLWAAPGGLPVAPGLVWPVVDCQVLPQVPSGKLPEASGLNTDLPETSEKPLPPGFPEAESLVSRDTAGEHPSG